MPDVALYWAKGIRLTAYFFLPFETSSVYGGFAMLQNMNVVHLDCECSSFDHSIRFCVDQKTGDFWLSTRLNSFLPLGKRLWRACLYVVSPTYGSFGHYDDTLIDHRDFGALRNLMAEAEKSRSDSTTASSAV